MSFDFKINLGKIAELNSPILISSGTFGLSEPYLDLIQDQKIGAVVTKTVTLEPKKGNTQPRIYEGKNFMINSIGLENSGVDQFVKTFEKDYSEIAYPIIISISGNDEKEYIDIIKKIKKLKKPIAIELNLSCPNVNSEGLASATDLKIFGKTISQCSKISDLPIITKLSPFQCINSSYAEVAENNGALAISMINTVPAMILDTENFSPFLGNITGGMSGPAIKPIALKMVYEISKKVKIPTIGMGGISNFKDVLDFLMVGASAVSIGTMNLVDPELPNEILKGIDKFLVEHQIEKIEELQQKYNKNI